MIIHIIISIIITITIRSRSFKTPRLCSNILPSPVAFKAGDLKHYACAAELNINFKSLHQYSKTEAGVRNPLIR